MSFVAQNSRENATLAEAHGLVRKRSAAGLPSYGIVAIAAGGQEIVEEVDFAANGIDDTAKLHLSVRTKVGQPIEGEPIQPFGEYANVGQTLRDIATAPNVATAIAHMIANEIPGITQETINQRLLNMPGVGQSFGAAVRKAWEEA